MSFTAPSGEIYLIKNILINSSYEHCYHFDSAVNQLAYFKGKKKYQLTDYSYSHKDSSIKVGYNIEDLYDVNYVLYKNKTSGKWIYAFINDKVYINEAVTQIIIETDVISTYQFDWTIKPSFVEREHQNRWYRSGTSYLPVFNIQPENLAYGDEYEIRAQTDLLGDGLGIKWYLVVSTEKLGDAMSTDSDSTFPVQKVPTPFHYYLIPDDGGIRECRNNAGDVLLNAYWFSQNSGLAQFSSVIATVLIPWIPFNFTYTWNTTPPYTQIHQTGSVTSHNITVGGVLKKIFKVDNAYTNSGSRDIYTWLRYYSFTFPTAFSPGISRDKKYEPKIYTFPYSYVSLTDHQGEHAVYKYEHFNANSVSLYTTQILSHQPKQRYYFSQYNLDVSGKNKGLLRAGVNELPVKTDAYENYIMQNKSQMISGLALSAVGTVAGVAVSAVSGGALAPLAIGAAVSSAQQIGSTLAKIQDIKRQPDNVKSAGNNLFFDIAEDNKLSITEYKVPNQVEETLYDYFHMYGYKCNRVKSPDLKTRLYFNYIKTIGANITGNFDNKDLIKIKSIFNNGVTFWHYRSGYAFAPMDYTYENVEFSLI